MSAKRNELTEKQMENLVDFFTVLFKFDEEALAALDKQIPMTQEIYDRCIDQCMEAGSDVDATFFSLLKEYPDFMVDYADRLEKKINEEYPDLQGMPEWTPEERAAMWQKLCERIREKYGEDAI
jgi:hypothetical protein